MTLQKIADYAMDYLDSMSIAAEYEITSEAAKIYIDDRSCLFFGGESRSEIMALLEAYI